MSYQLLGGIILIAIIVGLAYGMVTYLKQRSAEQAAAQREQAIADAQVMPVPCESGKLEFVAASPTVTYAGKPVTIPVTVTNRLGRSCYADLADGKVSARILTGQEIVFDSAKCVKDAPERRILFDKDMSWQTQLGWDGLIKDSKCEGTRPATRGTYRLQLQFDGKDQGKEVPFILESPPPPPKPAQKDGAKKEQS